MKQSDGQGWIDQLSLCCHYCHAAQIVQLFPGQGKDLLHQCFDCGIQEDAEDKIVIQFRWVVDGTLALETTDEV